MVVSSSGTIYSPSLTHGSTRDQASLPAQIKFTAV